MTETLADLMGWTADEFHPHIKYYYNLQQHTDAWLQARCGIITASVMKNLLKKKTDKKSGEVSYSVPDTDTTKAYLFELAAQRINNDIGDNIQTYDMQRGVVDEVDAFRIYSENYEPLKTCGFITNDEHGVLLGYSPDGLTALHDDGQQEAKSRKPKFQAETLYYDEMPDDFEIQVQTGLIVTKRKWCDFISYCGGMVMFRKRVEPDAYIQDQIIMAAKKADQQIDEIVEKVRANIEKYKFIPTEKRVEDITA